ncbi:hypothetical protein LMG22931_01014 [Paraburkholderia nemoris]|nr:hypothetical protein LMG22931_01014 [Paraburkholderia nemoris]
MHEVTNEQIGRQDCAHLGRHNRDGAAIAKRFQTEGATVIATGANPETLEKAKKEPWASKPTSFLCLPK